MKPYIEVVPGAWRGQALSASNLAYRPDGLYFIPFSCYRCNELYYELAASGRGYPDWLCHVCSGDWSAAEQSRHNDMVESGCKPWIAP